MDTEFTQPTQKLIQIGACLLDCKTGLISDDFSVFINPHEALTPEIVELTAIQQQDVDSGLEAAAALEAFWNYSGRKPIAAWGTDVLRLVKDSKELGVSHRNPRMLDVKTLSMVVRAATGKSSQGGLAPSMEAFSLAFQGRAHNALVDAKNTARLVWRWLSVLGAAEGLIRLASQPDRQA